LRAFKAANLSFDALRRMGRVERLRVVTRIFENAVESGDGIVDIVQVAREAKFTAQTMQRNGMSKNQAATIVRIVNDQTVRYLHAAFTDLLSNSTGLMLSATPSKLTGSGSGSINFATNFVINFIDAGQPVN
jgi:hypothetical protein